MTSMPAGADVIASIERQLDGLRKTADGEVLYRLIDKGLRRRDGNFEGTTAQAFIEFLYSLLGRYAANPEGDTATRVKVRLLQQRLAPHVQENAPRSGAADAAAQSSPASSPDTGVATTDAMNAAPTIESIEISAPELPDEPDWVAAAFVPEPAAEPEADSGPDDESLFPDLSPADPEYVVDAETIGDRDPELLLPDTDSNSSPSAADEAANRAPHELPDASPEHSLFGNPEIEIALDSDTLELDDAVARDSADTAAAPPTADPEWNNDIVINTRGLDEIAPPEANEVAAPKESAPDPHSIEFTLDRLAAVEKRNATAEAAPAAPPAAAKPVAPEPPAIAGEVVQRKADNGNSSRERVDKLHETFANKLADNLSRSKEFHKLVRSNLKALRLANEPGDVMDLRHLLVRGLEELLAGTESLGKDLGATSHYLKISQLDRDLLKDELTRVRGNSLVDELTGLQNQKAFLKQLQAEIGRAKRYGFSLAVAVLEINGLGMLEAENGKDLAKDVLTTYAKEILSQFRGYDLVARIGEHRFAVMFPNTQKEGAMAALEKAQKRASGMVIQSRGAARSLPGFSSVLTLYAPGDQPDMLLKRADDALILAKEKGVNQILVALPNQ